VIQSPGPLWSPASRWERLWGATPGTYTQGGRAVKKTIAVALLLSCGCVEESSVKPVTVPTFEEAWPAFDPEPAPKPIVMAPTYAEQRARAVSTGLPLVVFVGQPVQRVSGAVSAEWKLGAHGIDVPSVVISTVCDGDLWWQETATGVFTAAEIERRVKCCTEPPLSKVTAPSHYYAPQPGRSRRSFGGRGGGGC
jgi:hypothetical protein